MVREPATRPVMEGGAMNFGTRHERMRVVVKRTTQAALLAGLLGASLACEPTPEPDLPGHHTAYPVSIGGSFSPIAGDFIGPRSSQRPPVATEGEELIFYNPTGSNSEVWLGKKDENFPDDNTSWSLEKQSWATPSGAKPIVGNFAGDIHEDILWYRAGPGADLLWVGGTSAFPAQVLTVSVGNTYQPISLYDFPYAKIFWYAPGPAADSLWTFADSGNGSYTSTPQTVNGTFKPIVGHFDPATRGPLDIFWYAPGTAADSLWSGGTRTGWSLKKPMKVDGTYSPMTIGPTRGDLLDGILWWASGTAPDAVWVSNTRTLFAYKKAVNRSEAGTVTPYGLLLSDGRLTGPAYVVGGSDAGAGTLQIGSSFGALRGPAGALPFVGDFFGDSGNSSVVWYGPGTKPDSLWVQDYFF